MSDSVLIALIGGGFVTVTTAGNIWIAVLTRKHTDRTVGTANGQGTVVEMLERAIHTGEAAKEAAQGAHAATAATQQWCLAHDVKDDGRFDVVAKDTSEIVRQVKEVASEVKALRPLLEGATE